LTVAGSVIDANLEAGTYPTSWITTTAAAQTRSGDVARLIDAVALGGTTDRTIAIDAWMPNISPPGVGLALGSVDDATNANIMLLISPGTAAAVRAQIIAAGTQTVFGGDVASGARPNLVRAALANGAVWYGAVNGIVMSNPSAVSGTPSVQLGPLTTLHCGTNQLNTGQVDGSMQRVRYWPRLLSPTEVVTQTGGPTGLVMVLPWTANRPLIPGDVVRIPYRWNTSN
jgi:hypothetical protein